jgi:protein TonB
VKKIEICFFLLFCCFIFGQESVVGTTNLNELVLIEKNGKAKIDVEKPAQFSKGNEVFQNMLYENFRERKVFNSGKKETCEIIFIVDTDGLITDIKIIGDNEPLNKEALRAITKIKGKWIPAERNGEKVRYKFRIPITIHFDRQK